MNEQITYRNIFRVLFSTTAFALLIYISFLLRRELIWIAAGLFLALALGPAVNVITRVMPRRSRGLATGVVFFIFLGLIGFLTASLVPPLIHQTQQLVEKLPTYARDLQNNPGPIGDFARTNHLADKLHQSQGEILKSLTGAGNSVVSVLSKVFSGFAALFTILAVTFFTLLEAPSWNEGFWRLVPSRRRPEFKKLTLQMHRAVTGYVNGNLLTSLIAALATTIMLTIVGVPYSIPLGILVGVLDLLPLIGASLGAVMVVAVALFASPTAAIVMAVFFAIYQQVENHILQPLVYGRTVQISPLTVTVSAILGASLAGIFGAIVAIPLAACIKIAFDHYVERNE